MESKLDYQRAETLDRMRSLVEAYRDVAAMIERYADRAEAEPTATYGHAVATLSEGIYSRPRPSLEALATQLLALTYQEAKGHEAMPERT